MATSYQASDAYGTGAYDGRDGYSVAVYVDGYMDHVKFVDVLEARRCRWQLYKINRTLYLGDLPDGYVSLSDKRRQVLLDAQQDLEDMLGAMDDGRTAFPYDAVLSQENLDAMAADIYSANTARALQEEGG